MTLIVQENPLAEQNRKLKLHVEEQTLKIEQLAAENRKLVDDLKRAETKARLYNDVVEREKHLREQLEKKRNEEGLSIRELQEHFPLVHPVSGAFHAAHEGYLKELEFSLAVAKLTQEVGALGECVFDFYSENGVSTYYAGDVIARVIIYALQAATTVPVDGYLDVEDRIFAQLKTPGFPPLKKALRGE